MSIKAPACPNFYAFESLVRQVYNCPSSRSFGADVGNVIRMFRDAKVGDVVICPPIGHFRPYLIGEISAQWNKSDNVALDIFEGESVPSRRVKWIDTALTRHTIPTGPARVLQNQHAISRIDRKFYSDLLGCVYPSFIWDAYSKVDIYAEAYNSHDPTQPQEAAVLIKYSISAVSAFYAGKFSEFQKLDVDDAINEYFDEELLSQFTQSFSSPGKFSAVIRKASAVLLVSACIAVAGCGEDIPVSAQKQVVKEQITAVISNTNPAVSDDLDNFIDSMKDGRWTSVRHSIGRPAMQKMGLTLDDSAHVKRAKKKLDGE